MFRKDAITWSDLPSDIDGIESPNLELFRSVDGPLVAMVSHWKNGACQAVWTVTFETVEYYQVVDEMLHSVFGPKDQNGAYETTYLKIASSEGSEEVASCLSELSGRKIQLSHYLLIGLAYCAEVISRCAPIVVRHESFDRALSSLTIRSETLERHT